jgi:gliding motility-associated-like protein
VINAGADDTICAGSNVTLNGSGGVNYSWSPSLGLNDSTLANPVANPSSTTTYYLKGTSAQGCVNYDSVIITVNTYPVLNAGIDKNICAGDSVQLNATGGVSYNWLPVTGLSSSLIANPKASPVTSITYTVTSNNSGCVSSDSIVVNVDFVSAYAGNDTSICAGNVASLNASGGTSYSWLPATGLSSDTVSDPDAAPSTTTTYTVTAISGQCSAVDSIVITVNQLPVIIAGSDATICFGDSVVLSVSGASSYSWVPSAGLSNSLISNPVASPANTMAYTVTGTDINGCSASDAVTININPLPIINAGNDVSICQGTSVTLNATGSPTLLWSPASGLSSTTISSPVANPLITTSYIVTATSANGCTDKDTVVVTVHNSTLNTTSNTVNASCFGSGNGSASLTVTGGSGTYNYSWFPGGYNAANVNNLGAGTYTVSIADVITTCRDTSIVTINQPPDFDPYTGAVNATCGDANGIAIANVTGPSTYTYSWNTIPVQNTQSAINLLPGIYVVTVSDAFNCTKTDTAVIYSIDNLSASFSPSVTEGISPLNVFFTNNSTGANNYSWSFGDSQASSAFEPSHVFTGSGSYTVVLIASNATCLDTAEYTIVVEEELKYILPNVFTPNGDQKNDIFTLNGGGMKNFNGAIFNRWGKKIFEWNDPKGGWNGENQPDGVYYYTIEFKVDSGELKTLTGYVNLLR